MGALLAAPSIVRVASLMPVQSLPAGPYYVRDFLTDVQFVQHYRHKTIALGFQITRQAIKQNLVGPFPFDVRA